jgi:hypothetical protein
MRDQGWSLSLDGMLVQVTPQLTLTPAPGIYQVYGLGTLLTLTPAPGIYQVYGLGTLLCMHSPTKFLAKNMSYQTDLLAHTQTPGWLPPKFMSTFYPPV